MKYKTLDILVEHLKEQLLDSVITYEVQMLDGEYVELSFDSTDFSPEENSFRVCCRDKIFDITITEV